MLALVHRFLRSISMSSSSSSSLSCTTTTTTTTTAASSATGTVSVMGSSPSSVTLSSPLSVFAVAPTPPTHSPLLLAGSSSTRTIRTQYAPTSFRVIPAPGSNNNKEDQDPQEENGDDDDEEEEEEEEEEGGGAVAKYRECERREIPLEIDRCCQCAGPVTEIGEECWSCDRHLCVSCLTGDKVTKLAKCLTHGCSWKLCMSQVHDFNVVHVADDISQCFECKNGSLKKPLSFYLDIMVDMIEHASGMPVEQAIIQHIMHDKANKHRSDVNWPKKIDEMDHCSITTVDSVDISSPSSSSSSSSSSTATATAAAAAAAVAVAIAAAEEEKANPFKQTHVRDDDNDNDDEDVNNFSRSTLSLKRTHSVLRPTKLFNSPPPSPPSSRERRCSKQVASQIASLCADREPSPLGHSEAPTQADNDDDDDDTDATLRDMKRIKATATSVADSVVGL